MEISNYLDLLIDKKKDNNTCSPICIEGLTDVLQGIYSDLKQALPEGKFQKIMKEKSLLAILRWKNNQDPIPIYKIKELLQFWKTSTSKTSRECDLLYDKVYDAATYFRAIKSPIKVKVVKALTPDLAYLLGVIYADGSLRNIDLTFEQENRYRWEINITDETTQNLSFLILLLEEIFGIRTNVKKVYGGRWHRILFQSMILWRILHELFEMPQGYKKGRLKIPYLIKKSPFDIKKQFVIGFFDGDGGCSKDEKTRTPIVAVSQSSKGILEEFDLILREKGLFFKMYKKSSNGFDYYVLETKKRDQIKKFQEFFGFRDHLKKERLQKLIENF